MPNSPIPDDFSIHQDEAGEMPELHRTVFNISDGLISQSGFWRPGYTTIPNSIVSIPQATTLTKEEIVRLKEATHRIEQEAQHRRDSSMRPSEERASEYLDLIEFNKSQELKPEDIIQSEVPIRLSSIEWNTLAAIAQKGHTDIFFNKNNQFYRCADCARCISSNFAYFCNSRVYCAEHVPTIETCAKCVQLVPNPTLVETYDHQNVFVCTPCLNEYRCSNCKGDKPIAEILLGRCENCRTSRRINDLFRPYSTGMEYAECEELGETIKSKRIFSAEIEMFVSGTPHLHAISKLLPRQIGLAQDASIRQEYGLEIQSPRLQGKTGEKLLTDITHILNKTGAQVDRSCGLHIHLDGKSIMPKSRKEYPMALLQLWKAHLIFEDVILSFLPFERRASKYARPMRPYFSPIEIDSMETLYEVERLWYRQQDRNHIRDAKQHHHHSSRYFGFNLHPLLAQGHLEIRYHPGTTNLNKILEWVNLHALVMDMAAAGGFTNEFLLDAQNTLLLKDKTKMLFAQIGLAGKSKQYFFERQRKFADRKEGEDGKSRDRETPRLIETVTE